jgi:hypothetical protein
MIPQKMSYRVILKSGSRRPSAAGARRAPIEGSFREYMIISLNIHKNNPV